MKYSKILLPIVIVSALILSGCIQFGPGSQASIPQTTSNETQITSGLNWVSASGSALEKMKELEDYLKLKLGEFTLSNIETETGTNITRAKLTIGGQSVNVYVSPSGKSFWFENAMQELNGTGDYKEKVENYLKSILKPGVTYEFLGESQANGMKEYKYKLSYQGMTQNVSLFRFGNYVILDQAIQKVFSPIKSEVPDVKLFVMSFCPYGRMAESSMAPVEKLLGKLANITVHYVIYPSQMYAGQEDKYCIDNYCSMHGINELREDIRQMCIQKYYPDKFWDYIYEIAGNSSYSPETIEDMWIPLAEKLGINTTEIENCLENEGKAFLAREYALNQKYGVSGSPTIIINDERWDWSRTPEGFKWAICQAFENKPEECQQQISMSTASNHTPAGTCG